MVYKSSRRRSARGAASREALEWAAVRLVAEHGTAGASVDAVAAGAAVTKGSAYWHYRNKRDLVAAATARALEAWTTDMLPAVVGAGGPGERLKALVSAHVRHVQGAGSPGMCLMHACLDPEVGADTARRWRGRLRDLVGAHLEARASGGGGTGAVPEAVLGAFLGLAALWHATRDRLALETAGRAIGAGLASQLLVQETVTQTYSSVLSL